VLGSGNYYDLSVYQEFTQSAVEKNIFPFFGTEIIALETQLQAQVVRLMTPAIRANIIFSEKEQPI
jgi:hypothetical protein